MAHPTAGDADIAPPPAATITDEAAKRSLRGPLRIVAGAVAIGLALFQLYAAQFGMGSTTLRFVHVTAALLLAFLLIPARRGRDSKAGLALDLVFCVVVLLIGIYLLVEFEDALDRNFMPTSLDIAVSVAGILLVLEAARRAIGWQMPMISVVFLVYAYFGNLLPDPWGHAGRSLAQIASRTFISMEGVFGSPVLASATIVFMFLLLGAFLKESGVGQLFIDLALALFGRVRGGPAKVGVVSSALMGTISGSAVANVVGTGTFTIPTMKRLGYTPTFAGAVEAVASTGGQLMPPIMGSAAFIMAEVTGISYAEIAIAAALPAVLYYFAVYVQVDLEAAKLGLKGLPAAELPRAGPLVAREWPKLLPFIVLLVLLLVVEWSANKAALYTILAVIALSAVPGMVRFGPARLLRALESGAVAVIEVATACAAAGIIIGVLSLTGLGLKLSSILIDLAQGHLLVLLVLTMIASLILGMGLPTTAAYIILAVLVAPAVVKLGVSVMAAHLFVFYFGMVSTVTPPVALAAYAGASIAGADAMRTGFAACRLAIAAFIVPYMFVYGPALLLQGSYLEIAQAIVTATMGIGSIAAAVEGHLLGRMRLVERLVMFAGGMLLVHQGGLTDALGIGLVVAGVAYQWVVWRGARQAPAQH